MLIGLLFLNLEEIEIVTDHWFLEGFYDIKTRLKHIEQDLNGRKKMVLKMINGHKCFTKICQQGACLCISLFIKNVFYIDGCIDYLYALNHRPIRIETHQRINFKGYFIEL